MFTTGIAKTYWKRKIIILDFCCTLYNYKESCVYLKKLKQVFDSAGKMSKGFNLITANQLTILVFTPYIIIYDVLNDKKR